MAFDPSNAQQILGISFFPGFGPGNSGATFEYPIYYSTFNAYAFFPVPTNTSLDFKLIELFENQQNTRIITATTGTGGVAYGTNGGLTLSTGSTATGSASAMLNYLSWDFSASSLLMFNIVTASVGLSTGSGEFAIGRSNATSLPTEATTTAGVWVYVDIVAGTPTYYFCTANGSAVTATDVTADVTSLDLLTFTFTADGGELTSVSCYQGQPNSNGALLATHTTTLPTGAVTAAQQWRTWITTGDSNDRSVGLHYSEFDITLA